LGAIAAICCAFLAFKLDPLVLKVYSFTCPMGLLIYFLYGRKHSKLGMLQKAKAQESAKATVPEA
jgi:hypothetical protein